MESRSIAMITDDFLPEATGVGVHVQKISREMVAQGHRVTVVTTRRRGQPAEEMWEGVKVYRVFSIPIARFYQAMPSRTILHRIFLENSVGMVHCHYLSYMMLRAISVAKQMGIPTILTTHMTVDHLTQPFFMRPWRAVLSRLIARMYEKFGDVVSVSAAYARHVEHFAISSKVHYISNPVDFDGTEVTQAPLGDSFRIFFVGRLNPEKNLPLLLRALRLLKEKSPAVELWIAGQGSQEKELRQLTESLGLANEVKFLGQVKHNDLPALYSSANVFVLPSLVEMQPLVALEAMRFRRPVVVTNRIVSAQEMVDDGKNGFIVDPAGPEEMAERLNRLRLDPELCRRMGDAGFEKSASYTLPAVVQAFVRLYDAVGMDPTLRIDESDKKRDKRRHCTYCQIGIFERRAEHLVVSSDSQHFKEEYFAVWRCAFCRSIHSFVKFPLEDYYKHSPFLKRQLNPYNRIFFNGFYHWLEKKGIGPQTRILFYGHSATLFRDFLKEQGYTRFEIIEKVMDEEGLAAESLGSFEFVISVDVLERAEDPRLFFDFLARQLVPGGRLILMMADAEKIRLPFNPMNAVHQPYRLHIASYTALLTLAQAKGFRHVSTERRSYMDTLVPFINYRAFQELPFFVDGTLESALSFRPRDAFRKFWRIPLLVFWGFLGGLFRERSNLSVVFTKP